MNFCAHIELRFYLFTWLSGQPFQLPCAKWVWPEQDFHPFEVIQSPDYLCSHSKCFSRSNFLAIKVPCSLQYGTLERDLSKQYRRGELRTVRSLSSNSDESSGSVRMESHRIGCSCVNIGIIFYSNDDVLHQFHFNSFFCYPKITGELSWWSRKAVWSTITFNRLASRLRHT